MKVTAAVYRQAAPELVKPIRKFIGADGQEYMEHRANLAYVGDVTGTYHECWQQAKALCVSPVVEFPREMYRRAYVDHR